MGLHFILQHLDRPGTYARILFLDFSYAFNTIIPDTLQNKLTFNPPPTTVCHWITSFLTDRQKLVRLGKFSSSTRTISTGAPRGCVLSPLLFSLYTIDCTSKDASVKLLKFADDSDKSAYRQEVKELTVWCSLNNLELNTLKRVEMIVDYRRTPRPPPPPPGPHHEQHCDCSGVIQIPGHHNFSGPEVGQSHWVHGEKGPAEAVLPSPADEVQPATGAVDTVLLFHHWIHPLHVNNCLVQFSYQIWPQKTMEGSPDCWANHWHNPPYSPRTVLIQSEQKGLAKSLWTPHIQHTPSSNCYQTQKQFLSHLINTWY